MPKYTLLDMVKRVARAINSDEVSQLNETVEAVSIQVILMDMLDDLLTRQDWEFLKDHPTKLEPGGNQLQLKIPTWISKVQSVKYATASQPGGTATYRTLTYLPAGRLLDMLQETPQGAASTTTVNINGVLVTAPNNRPPRYWTSFDEETIYVDSYEMIEDPTGIDANKSAILGHVYLNMEGSGSPTWIAPIPEKLFTLWYQEAVAEAQFKLRQMEDGRAERRARRLFVANSRNEPLTTRDDNHGEVNYGR